MRMIYLGCEKTLLPIGFIKVDSEALLVFLILYRKIGFSCLNCMPFVPTATCLLLYYLQHNKISSQSWLPSPLLDLWKFGIRSFLLTANTERLPLMRMSLSTTPLVVQLLQSGQPSGPITWPKTHGVMQASSFGQFELAVLAMLFWAVQIWIAFRMP